MRAPLDEFNIEYNVLNERQGEPAAGGVGASPNLKSLRRSVDLGDLLIIENSEEEYTLLEVIRRDHPGQPSPKNSIEVINIDEEPIGGEKTTKSAQTSPESSDTESESSDTDPEPEKATPLTSIVSQTKTHQVSSPIVQVQEPKEPEPEPTKQLEPTKQTKLQPIKPIESKVKQPEKYRVRKTGSLSDILTKLHPKKPYRIGLNKTHKIESLHKISK